MQILNLDLETKNFQRHFSAFSSLTVAE